VGELGSRGEETRSRKTKTQIVDKDKWWKGAYMKLRRTHPERKVIALSPQFVSWSYLLYRELRRRFQRMRLGHYPGEKPMSGFFAFFFTLQLCDQVCAAVAYLDDIVLVPPRKRSL